MKKQLELIIIVGNSYVITAVPEYLVRQTNEELKDAVATNSIFSRNDVTFAIGKEIKGWYYREIKETPSESACKAIAKMAESVVKDSNEGDEWKG